MEHQTMARNESSNKPSVYDSLMDDTVQASDSLRVMMANERNVYFCHDYLRLSNSEAVYNSDAVTNEDRLKIVDWCFSIVDHCEFSREVVVIAMELADRFFSVNVQTRLAQEILHDQKQFQLAVMTALYIAIKIHERVVFGSDFVAEMSRGTYTVEEIESMERTILKGVGWRLCAPTSLQVAHHLLSLVAARVDISEDNWGFILDEIGFQTENAVRDYYFTLQRQSSIGLAAILNAIEQVDETDELLDALLSEIDGFDFSSAPTLFAAKNRLRRLVEDPSDNRSSNDELKYSGQDLRSSYTSVMTNECFDDFDIADDSPDSVACCRRESVFCQHCTLALSHQQV